MEFRLPEKLHHELLAYDPALKALAKEKAIEEGPATIKKKSKYPIGNINDLIPVDIVPAAEMQQAVDHINAQITPRKYWVFYTQIPETNNGITYAHNIVKAILYYYESTWIAAWLPNEDEDYLYGFSYAISTTKATRKRLDGFKFGDRDLDFSLDDMTLKKYGRVEYRIYTKKITSDEVRCGHTYHWNPSEVTSWTEKGKHIKNHCINPFHNQLAKSIPAWEDERNLFARVNKRRNNLHYLFAAYLTCFPGITEIVLNLNWLPTAANLTPHIQRRLCVPADILNKPFIQKELQAVCNKVIQIFQDPTTTKFTKALDPMHRFVHYMYGIKWLHDIWPNTPIDYYQTYKDALSCLDYNNYRMTFVIDNQVYLPVRDWLRKHMPVSSIVLILDKYYKENYEPHIGHKYGEKDELLCYQLADTFAMLSVIFNANKTIDPPKRWRLTEFHDYVQAESWKVKNNKISLPQDLFPTPIKVEYLDQKWTFFQPSDTHQLASWGQAVRNCVGSHNQYAEAVEKRKEFIVLCMIEGKPVFTIQLSLNQGMLAVRQIKGISNKTLTNQEESDYAEVFKQALALRNAVA